MSPELERPPGRRRWTGQGLYPQESERPEGFKGDLGDNQQALAIDRMSGGAGSSGGGSNTGPRRGADRHGAPGRPLTRF